LTRLGTGPKKSVFDRLSSRALSLSDQSPIDVPNADVHYQCLRAARKEPALIFKEKLYQDLSAPFGGGRGPPAGAEAFMKYA
jgi:hypothetical protein